MSRTAALVQEVFQDLSATTNQLAGAIQTVPPSEAAHIAQSLKDLSAVMQKLQTVLKRRLPDKVPDQTAAGLVELLETSKKIRWQVEAAENLDIASLQSIGRLSKYVISSLM